MSTGTRVFLFGCGRSGTTLLLSMFSTIDGVACSPREHSIREFAFIPPGDVATVLKRSPLCAVDLHVELAKDPDVFVVNIVRDPRDVVTSRFEIGGAYRMDYRRWERDVGAFDLDAIEGLQWRPAAPRSPGVCTRWRPVGGVAR